MGIFKKIGFSAAVLFLFILLVEGISRLLPDPGGANLKYVNEALAFDFDPRFMWTHFNVNRFLDELPSVARRYGPDRSPRIFNIICIGDSVTQGNLSGALSAWPDFLQKRLSLAFPLGDFRVDNLGVAGFSSFQGRELLERIAEGLRSEDPAAAPDVVFIAFGRNDQRPSSITDADRLRRLRKTPVRLLYRLEKTSRFVRLMRIVMLGREYRRMETEADNGGDPPGVRVPLEDYRAYTGETVDLARKMGALPILLNLDFPLDYAKTVYPRISREKSTPYLDVAGEFERRGADRRIWRKIDMSVRSADLRDHYRRLGREYREKRGAFEPADIVGTGDAPVRVFFSLTLPPGVFNEADTEGPPPRLRLCLGRSGDAAKNLPMTFSPASGRWETVVGLRRAGALSYVFSMGDGASEFKALRRVALAGRGENFQPPTLFGLADETVVDPAETQLMIEETHPNSTGNRLIADLVFDLIRGLPEFRDFLEKMEGD